MTFEMQPCMHQPTAWICLISGLETRRQGRCDEVEEPSSRTRVISRNPPPSLPPTVAGQLQVHLPKKSTDALLTEHMRQSLELTLQLLDRVPFPQPNPHAQLV